MCYSNKIEYKIIPKGSYKVIRNCAKCGCKSYFINTNKFRINANGNQLDVWLIYQCEECKHTFNLTIYERKRPSEINNNEYIRILANDIDLATEYGNKKEIFARNKSEIDLESLQYQIIQSFDGSHQSEEIIIRNPYELKLRTDRVLADIFKITRSMVKSLIAEKKLLDIPKYLSREIQIPYLKV